MGQSPHARVSPLVHGVGSHRAGLQHPATVPLQIGAVRALQGPTLAGLTYPTTPLTELAGPMTPLANALMADRGHPIRAEAVRAPPMTPLANALMADHGHPIRAEAVRAPPMTPPGTHVALYGNTLPDRVPPVDHTRCPSLCPGRVPDAPLPRCQIRLALMRGGSLAPPVVTQALPPSNVVTFLVTVRITV